MPIISRSLHGITAGVAPSGRSSPPALRGVVDGWSPDACRRNTAWLRTVDHTALDGFGIAFTGTVQTCPETHDDWHKLQRAFVERLRRMGLVRLHWVIEWQRRGVPHLHAAMYFPVPSTPSEHASLLSRIEAHWLAVSASYGSQSPSQTVKPIYDMGGWSQYVAKHASRGVSHYQRSPDCQPQHWEKTGRIWGHIGSWPTVDPEKLEISMEGYHAFRRLARAWRIADARASGKSRRIRSARRCLRCPYPDKSPLRGVSEWIPSSVQDSILRYLVSAGFAVAPREPETSAVRMLAPRMARSTSGAATASL